MISKEVLRLQAAQYQDLANQLRHAYAAIDEETLTDTLSGISDLPEMIEEIVRASLDDSALVIGLKARLDEISARLARLKERYEKKRQLACWGMTQAGMNRLEVDEFAASIAQGSPKLEISDESKLPTTFFVPTPPRLDRIALTNALKRGEAIDGAHLASGQPHITVRTK